MIQEIPKWWEGHWTELMALLTARRVKGESNIIRKANAILNCRHSKLISIEKLMLQKKRFNRLSYEIILKSDY